MQVHLIRGDIARLKSEYAPLLESDPSATPYASCEWLTAWNRHWGAGGEPWVLAAYDGDRLAGMAAFLLRSRGGLRHLSGLGVGVGNYWDVIAAPAEREQVVGEMADALVRESSTWDALFIDKLPEESPTLVALRTAGLRVDRETRWASPRIELPATFDDYLAALSRSRRSRIRRNLRVLESGELTVREVSDPAELNAAVERWQALRVAWWAKRDRQMDAEHGSERFLAFTHDALAAMVPAGQAVVWEISYRGEILGVTINYIDERSFYYWLWGFDARLEELRPGHTLIAYAIRWSIETGRRYFDFMVGDEAYKYDYAPVDRAVLSATVGNRCMRSRTTLGMSRLRHAALPAEFHIPIFGRNA